MAELTITTGRGRGPQAEGASPWAGRLRKRRGRSAPSAEDTLSPDAGLKEEDKAIPQVLGRSSVNDAPALTPRIADADHSQNQFLDAGSWYIFPDHDGIWHEPAPAEYGFNEYDLRGDFSHQGDYFSVTDFSRYIPDDDEAWRKPGPAESASWEYDRGLVHVKPDINPSHQTPFAQMTVPESSDVSFPVAAVGGHELQPGPITDIARALAALDHAVLLFSWVNSGAHNAGLFWGPIGDVLHLLKDGIAGRRMFHRLYPTSPVFASYWRDTLRLAIRGRLMADAGARWDAQTREDFRGVEKHAERLRQVVVETKHLMLPEKDALQRAIEVRWRILVDIVDAIYYGSGVKRQIADWDRFFSIDDVLVSGIHPDVLYLRYGPDYNIAAHAVAGDIRSRSSDVESAGGSFNTRAMAFSKYLTSILWLTFLAAAPLSIVSFALALRYSEPNPGTTTDGDFWLLLQNCGMQLVSLAGIVAPVWGGRVVSGHARVALLVFIGVVGVGTVTAPFCYVRLPKAWSGFVVIVSGCINAFATLQMGLAMHRVKGKG